jgi:hypothetical protein
MIGVARSVDARLIFSAQIPSFWGVSFTGGNPKYLEDRHYTECCKVLMGAVRATFPFWADDGVVGNFDLNLGLPVDPPRFGLPSVEPSSSSATAKTNRVKSQLMTTSVGSTPTLEFATLRLTTSMLGLAQPPETSSSKSSSRRPLRHIHNLSKLMFFT